MRNLIAFCIIAIMAFVCAEPVMADKKSDYTTTYNYKRALEMLDENKPDEAINYFQAEVSDHRDNGYAYSMLGYIQCYQEKYGEALTNLNLALKYLPKKDGFYSFALRERANVYKALGDDKSAMADRNQRVKLFPKDEESFEDRGSYFLDVDDFDLAIKDFEKAIELNPANEIYYVAKGICLRSMERVDEAIVCFEYALKLDTKYSAAYFQRGYCRFLKKEYSSAAEDYANALMLDGSNAAFIGMQELADSSFEAMDFRLKIMQMGGPTEVEWPYYRAIIYEKAKRYNEAIELYAKSNKILYSTTTTKRIAICKKSQGNYAGALESINDAISVDSTNESLLHIRADLYHKLGQKQNSYNAMIRLIELDPTNAYYYYLKGWYEKCNGDYDAAIEDLNMAIMLSPDYIWAHITRANVYTEKGMMREAEADYKKVLEVDTVDGNYYCAHYAHLALGDRNKAFAAMQANLEKDSVDNFYDAACLYSLARERDKALYYMRRALETGYVDFHHIEIDTDLDYIRNEEKFKKMVGEWREKVFASFGGSETTAVSGDTKVVEIPFTHEGGVTKIKCDINGLPLFFVFDTGASDVTISTVEATFMLKNGYLAERDIVGRQNYMTADGNICEGTTIMLRKVKIGDLELDDVKASVVQSQRAPLLLGQTVLQRLGKIEIDNNRNVLKVTQQ